jgi:cytochrome P450
MDTPELRESASEKPRSDRPVTEITRANLVRHSPTEQQLSARGAPDDSRFDEIVKKLAPLRIEEVLGGLRGFLGKLVMVLAPSFFGLLRLLRIRKFRLPFTSIRIITRFDDVQEVLARDDIFRTPFGAKAAVLGWKPPFLLDQQDGPDYRGVKKDVEQHFEAVLGDLQRVVKRNDLATIKKISFDVANEILDRHIGQQQTADIDVIRELVLRVPTRVCQHYYGMTSLATLSADELREFEDCFVTVSAFMFGDGSEPEANKPSELGRRAIQAAVIIRARIRLAIERAWLDRASSAQRDDVLFRMVCDDTKEAGGTNRRFDDARMTSYLFAMMLGFIPTNLMANGNMLEMLFGRLRRSPLKTATQAARDGDDDLLRRCLFEAMRFRPLNPGPWRKANRAFQLAVDTRWPKKVERDWTILASTQSAMFDSRRVLKPRRFNPERSPYVYMLYGYGLHRCIGKPIADVQITQTMKALLRRPKLRPTGWRAWIGWRAKVKRAASFPFRMKLRYDAGGPAVAP